MGALREDIIEGKTEFVFRPGDPVELAETIETYFSSELYRGLRNRRQELRDYANVRHSWDVVGQITRKVYAQLLEK